MGNPGSSDVTSTLAIRSTSSQPCSDSSPGRALRDSVIFFRIVPLSLRCGRRQHRFRRPYLKLKVLPPRRRHYASSGHPAESSTAIVTGVVIDIWFRQESEVPPWRRLWSRNGLSRVGSRRQEDRGQTGRRLHPSDGCSRGRLLGSIRSFLPGWRGLPVCHRWLPGLARSGVSISTGGRARTLPGNGPGIWLERSELDRPETRRLYHLRTTHGNIHAGRHAGRDRGSDWVFAGPRCDRCGTHASGPVSRAAELGL